jgi:hypothetical protein
MISEISHWTREADPWRAVVKGTNDRCADKTFTENLYTAFSFLYIIYLTRGGFADLGGNAVETKDSCEFNSTSLSAYSE